MLKTLLNEAHVRLDITTQGPLLIKTGYATVIGANMAPVQTYRHGQSEIYLPGSSLKGVFRSHIEKVVNSIKPRVACNPLPQTEEQKDGRKLYRTACGNEFNDRTPAQQVYAGSCPTCRLFGSTSYIGRISVEDAYLPEGTYAEDKHIEHRDGIAINRLTGGVNGNAKFDLETVRADTTFTTSLRLRNFEIWQLGMLFVLLQDMEDQLLHLGSGSSRGLGKVKATLNAQGSGPYAGGLTLTTARMGATSREPEQELWGLGHWLEVTGEKQETYGTEISDLLVLDTPVAHTPRGVRYIRTLQAEALDQIKAQCIEAFVARMQTWEEAPLPSSTRS